MNEEQHPSKYYSLIHEMRERDRNIHIRCYRVAARHQRNVLRLCEELGIEPFGTIAGFELSREDLNGYLLKPTK